MYQPPLLSSFSVAWEIQQLAHPKMAPSQPQTPIRCPSRERWRDATGSMTLFMLFSREKSGQINVLGRVDAYRPEVKKYQTPVVAHFCLVSVGKQRGIVCVAAHR